MRIISGDWRGRKLVAPKGDITRPTADRTREALFSMLTSRIGSFDDLQILDLFAGSGALGLEALSRGGAHCTFVEQDRDALRALETNIETLKASADIKIGSVLALVKAKKQYDIIFMDPPYNTGAGAVALDKLKKSEWFSPSSWISIETDRNEEIAVKGFILDIMRNIGRARIHLFRPANI